LLSKGLRQLYWKRPFLAKNVSKTFQNVSKTFRFAFRPPRSGACVIICLYRVRRFSLRRVTTN